MGKIKIYIKKQKQGMARYILVMHQKVIPSVGRTHKIKEKINGLIKIEI